MKPYLRSRTRSSVPVVAAFLAGALSTLNSVSAADVTLPADAALPITSTLGPAGFTARTVLAPADSVLGNSYLRAIKQLDGSLLDATGVPYANIANPGPNADGSYDLDVVNLSLTADGDYGQFVFPDYPDVVFPGLPEGGPTTQFSTEVVTFLNLPAGTYTFGITAQNDRTDVNDDDGWKLFAGLNAKSFFATPIAEFGHTAPPFTVNKKGNTNEFNVIVPVDGIYPFRLTYWQTGRGAQLEWYLVIDPTSDTPTRLLLNDPSAAYAYRSVAVPAANGPYVTSISPQPDSSGVAPTAPVEAVIADGEKPIDLATVKLYLNNTAVTPQTLVRDGKYVRLAYKPNASRVNPDNKIRLEFKDTAGLATTNSWQFAITVSGAPSTIVRGQWDFDNGDLSATTGKALRYFDRENDGFTAGLTQFGSTTDFGIPDINGQPAKVLRVPGNLDNRIGYVMEHGISPNGGGTRVNQYTITWDIYVETTGPGAASLLQISDLNNKDDGDLFWQGSNFGQGGGGYNGTGAFTAGAWHRVTAAYDLAANPPVVTKYVDGIKQDDWTANQQLDGDRRALKPTAILFGDGDQDERRVMYVNSIQIREGKLSDAEMVLLGGPSASGIPQTLPTVSVAGQWDFDSKNLRATVGKDLQYFDRDDGAGLTKLTETLTQYGTTTEFGIDDINGQPAQVMRVPGDLDNHIGYVMTHGISPNGGGTKVNQYTIIFDIYVATTGPGAASLLQISDVNNKDDGDLFWQGSNFGQGGGGYNGTGAFTAGAWHRVTAAYDLAANPPVVTKYVDGIKQDDWTANQQLDGARRALQPTAILFGDGDQDERRVMYVNSIQIRPGKLSDAQMTLLGGPSADGIPLVIPTSNVTGQWDFDSKNLRATVGKDLQYFDRDDGAGLTKLTETLTQYGTTTEFGIDDIDGEPANVMRVPGELDNHIGYVMTHGIAPNGGGSKVNQYTIIFDIYVATSGPGAASLLQISDLSNKDDGDLFWQGSNFGQGGGGYNGTGAFKAGSWHRVSAAYNLAATPPVVTKYVDGIFQDDWTANQQLDGARRALQPTAILFGDGDQDERRVMYVNSIQIRSGALSKPELEALGGPKASGIPIALPPKITATAGNGILTLSWPTFTGGYILESATDLIAPNWQAVAGVVNNSVTVTTTGSELFFRLRKL